MSKRSPGKSKQGKSTQSNAQSIHPAPTISQAASSVSLLRIGILLAVVLVVLVVGLLLRPLFNTAPPNNGISGHRIAFVRHPLQDGGLRSLYVVGTDGTNQQQITNSVDVEGSIGWSPKGNSIIMQAGVDKVSTIVRVDIGSDNKVIGSAQLTADLKADSAAPAWSPDGTMIAFMSKANSQAFQVYVMNADGSNKRRLVNNDKFAGFPVWSPDGKKLIYLEGDASTGANRELYEISVDGGTPQQITHLGATLNTPRWSPDGKLIMVVQANGDSSDKLLVMNADGSDIRTVDEVRNIFAISFSPASDAIIYDTVTDSGSDLALYDLKSARTVSLASLPGENYSPSWSPDGTMIAWASTSGDQSYHIVIANKDGTNARTISSGDGDDYYPDWEPSDRE